MKAVMIENKTILLYVKILYQLNLQHMFMQATSLYLYLLSSWNSDPRVIQALKDTSFDRLLQIQGGGLHYHVLYMELIQNFNVKHNYFVFNNYSFYFGLLDVMHTTGLPVDGKPVICDESHSHDLCISCLGGKVKCIVLIKKGKIVQFTEIYLSHLKNVFEKVLENASSEVLEQHVRAAVLYVIGSIIMPAVSRTVVSYSFLYF